LFIGLQHRAHRRDFIFLIHDITLQNRWASYKECIDNHGKKK